MAELVLGPEVPADDGAAVSRWLARNGVSARDAAALTSEIERLSVYRGLVRGRLRDAVGLAIPRARARLAALFDEYFDRFLAERGPRSHYLRDVTTEFLDFLAPLAASDARVPPWALDLARHEALDILIGSLSEAKKPRELPELDPDRGLAFSSTARVVHYDFAVHRLSADPADTTEPERAATSLFVHRNPAHEVRYLEVTPLAARILERLLDGATLRQALEEATGALDLPLDGAVLEGTARVLSDLAERGAVLGAREAKSAAIDLQNPTEPAENGRGDRR